MGHVHWSPLWDIILASWWHCWTEWLIQNGMNKAKRESVLQKARVCTTNARVEKQEIMVVLTKHVSNPLFESSKTRKWLQPEDGILWHEIYLTFQRFWALWLMRTMDNTNNKSNKQQTAQVPPSPSTPSPPLLPWTFSAASHPLLSLTSSDTWTMMLFINKSSATNDSAKMLLTPWWQERYSSQGGHG